MKAKNRQLDVNVLSKLLNTIVTSEAVAVKVRNFINDLRYPSNILRDEPFVFFKLFVHRLLLEHGAMPVKEMDVVHEQLFRTAGSFISYSAADYGKKFTVAYLSFPYDNGCSAVYLEECEATGSFKLLIDEIKSMMANEQENFENIKKTVPLCAQNIIKFLEGLTISPYTSPTSPLDDDGPCSQHPSQYHWHL